MKLREFQKEAIDRALKQNLYLAAKPGAGKTAVAVHVAKEMGKRVLVVTPKRVVPQFASEAVKWGIDLTFVECMGPEKSRLAALERSCDVLVTSHEHFPWLAKTIKAKDWDFAMVVFDEASRLRKGGRQGSVGWKAMNAIRQKTDCRFLLMSGSPRPGTAHELFAPVFLLDGGRRLGKTLSGFREAYLEPNKVDRYTGRVFSWRLREGMEGPLYSKIADLYYAVSPDLGLKYVEIDRHIEMPEHVEQQCRRMMRELVADFEDEITAGSLGAASMKLQQMGSGEVFNDSGGTTVVHDKKVEDLQDLVEELDGEPLMVAYWYTHERERLMRMFPDLVDITTEKGLADAKAGKVKFALIHPGSAGHGVDGLQYHFSAMYWYTLPHSYELYDQTIKRVSRNGQEETVRVFRALASTDIKIRDALATKEQEQEAFYEFLTG